MLEVDCKAFAEAVDRVSTISTEKSRAVKLAIERGSLIVSATSPENGTAVEELEVRYSAQARSKSASTLATCWTSPSRSRARARSSSCPTPARRRSCATAPTPARSTS